MDKIGLVNLTIQKNQDGVFEFLITDCHPLAKDFSDIYSVRQALKRGVVLFTCYNLGKRYVLYDTYTKEVLKTEWISEHCGSKIEYGVPVPVPSKDYLETGIPSLFGLRDAKSLFIIDVREDGETHLLGTNIMAGFGLSKVFVDYTSTIQEESKDQPEP